MSALARLSKSVAGILLTISSSLACAQTTPSDVGQRLFTQQATPACALCHTLRAAGAEGAIGPDLDELRPDSSRVLRALRSGLGQMPSYANSLDDAQMRAVAEFVAGATQPRSTASRP